MRHGIIPGAVARPVDIRPGLPSGPVPARGVPKGTDVSSSIPPRTGTSIKAISVTLLVVGVLLILFALFADTLGIGGGRGFGYQQLIVLIVGLVLVLSGGALVVQPYLNRVLRD